MSKELDKSLIESYVNTSQEIEKIENKISSSIAKFQTQLDEKNKQESELKDAIKEAMKNRYKELGDKKIENEIIRITYVAPTTRVSIDTKKLKEDKPELWDKYSKTSKVSDNIKIKVK